MKNIEFRENMKREDLERKSEAECIMISHYWIQWFQLQQSIYIVTESLLNKVNLTEYS